jgi:hypothetical protein
VRASTLWIFRAAIYEKLLELSERDEFSFEVAVSLWEKAKQKMTFRQNL